MPQLDMQRPEKRPPAPRAGTRTQRQLQRRYARFMIWCLVVLTLVILSQSSLLAARTQKRGESVLTGGEVVYVPAEAQTRLMYLGYEQAAADVLWVRTLNYFARHFVTDRKYPWLRHFLDQILSLDPDFHDVYLWAGSSLLYGRLLTNERVLEANQYYERALERFPNDHEAAYRLGMNYHAELVSEDEDERGKFRRKGLYYLELAANMPDAPKRIGELVAALNLKYGADDLAIQYLTDLYLKTSNVEERERLLTRMTALQDKKDKVSRQSELEKFQTQWTEELPYASQVFFGIIGSRLTPSPKQWQAQIDVVDLSKDSPASHQ